MICFFDIRGTYIGSGYAIPGICIVIFSDKGALDTDKVVMRFGIAFSLYLGSMNGIYHTGTFYDEYLVVVRLSYITSQRILIGCCFATINNSINLCFFYQKCEFHYYWQWHQYP